MQNSIWTVLGPVFLGTIVVLAAALVVPLARRRQARNAREGRCYFCGRELAEPEGSRTCAKCARSLRRVRAMLNIMLILSMVVVAAIVWMMVLQSQARERVQWEHAAFLAQMILALFITRRRFEIF